MHGVVPGLLIGSFTVVPVVGGYAYLNDFGLWGTTESLEHIRLENPQDIRNKYQEITCLKNQFSEIIWSDIEVDAPKPTKEQLQEVGEIDMDGCLATWWHKDLYEPEYKWKAKMNIVVTLVKDTRGLMFVSQTTANEGKFTTDIVRYALKKENKQWFAFKEKLEEETETQKELPLEDICSKEECQGEPTTSSKTWTKEIQLSRVSYDKLENLDSESSKHLKERISEVDNYVGKAMCSLVNEHKYNLNYILKRNNWLSPSNES